MFHLTHPSCSDAVPAPPADGPRCIAQYAGISPMIAATNQFLVHWLRAIANDGSLPYEALAVASVMARSVGVGRVAFIDWQRINVALGRYRRDLAVFETMSELELEGYLDRDADNPFVYGWLLLIPNGEL
ncbi:hypothetical protein NG701_04975 [Pseudarthrobacter sp. HLT3-5]|uniref:hypothetical protein n=1 Tax=Pseudarthrobacter cellobiosi TaxID=2953654 RepID=UPI00208E6F4E|nr:hypothetical protein [Pseudarthrobacter sp. HLT3-5]MCO4273787.1 hypothetical protein [Pseudarthrobacter sp. HLT3-5]